MRRIVTPVIALAAVLATSFVSSGSALASTTQCSGKFCGHVEGTGLHVAWAQFCYTVPRNETYSGDFYVTTYNDGKYSFERVTGKYTWHTPGYYPDGKKWCTYKVNVSRNFPNNTKLYLGFNKDNYPYSQGEVHAVIHR